MNVVKLYLLQFYVDVSFALSRYSGKRFLYYCRNRYSKLLLFNLKHYRINDRGLVVEKKVTDCFVFYSFQCVLKRKMYNYSMELQYQNSFIACSGCGSV